MSSPTLVLKGSDRRGQKVIILDPNELRIAEYEARWDADPDLSRSLLASAASISEAKNLVRQGKYDIAVIMDGYGNMQLPAVQVELQSASDDIEFVIVTDTLDPTTLRECISSGRILDIVGTSTIANFEEIKSLILNSFRRLHLRDDSKFKISADICAAVSRAIIATNPQLAHVKDVSAHLLRTLLPRFDLNTTTAMATVLAEQAYFRHIEPESYANILVGAQSTVIDILSSTGTDRHPPTTPSALLITATNLIGEMIQSGLSLNEIRARIESMPISIRHRSIRGFTDDTIDSAIQHSYGFIRAS